MLANPADKNYSKTCVKWPLSERQKISLNAIQKYCIVLQGEHSAILSTFIKVQFVIKILFCLFLSGRFTKVSLLSKFGPSKHDVNIMRVYVRTISP